MQKENWFKLDLFHWDFLSSLVKGLWFYICKHYGEEVKMPETKVVFMTERIFKKFVRSVDLSESLKKEYGRRENIYKAHMVYFGQVQLEPVGDKTCHCIAIRKAKLQKARRFLIKHFRQDFSLAETILLGLIHETIHLYEDITRRTYLDHSKKILMEAEKAFFMRFKNDHPEYFSDKNERNILNTLKKIPDR